MIIYISKGYSVISSSYGFFFFIINGYGRLIVTVIIYHAFVMKVIISNS
jgi:hypothetical protein